MTRPRRPYMLPSLLAGAESPCVDNYSRSAMCAAWEAGKDANSQRKVKATRERLSSWRLTPAELAAIARAMRDRTHEYCSRPHNPEGAQQPCEWLVAGSGCTACIGTLADAHSAAWAVLYAAVSILVEVEIERPEDETALLDLLSYVGWRVPDYQRARVARRMARHVARLIDCHGLIPWHEFAAQGARS